MNNIAIKVENLGKRYRIGEIQQYKALRDTMTDALYAPFRGISQLVNPKSEITNPKSNNHIWALKDVSFEVKQGEVIGIIGRNGAGKSTLLKILSRITEPTEGRAEIHGRMGSLLEVGTGFHPELTGRENIYLNGAIIGMKKVEIVRKFDEIVAFAEIEKFIDTPVKHYSSGMYVRLAFAVAAHLEPEILLIDEVLAVGDLAFQKKCLGKMEDVAKEGRTVLFVSHNMQAISQLCNRAILLDNGKLSKDDATQQTLNAYIGLDSGSNTFDGGLKNPRLRTSKSDPDSLFKWTYAAILNSKNEPTLELRYKEPFKLIFRGYAAQACKNVIVGFNITNKIKGIVFNSHQIYNGLPNTLKTGTSEFQIGINPNVLAPGIYTMNIGATGPNVGDWIQQFKDFRVLDLGITPDKSWHAPYQGGVIDYPWCKWSSSNQEQ